jgi:hypothetical protein
MAHLGPDIGGGVKISPPNAPHPVTPSGRALGLQKCPSAPVRLPWGAVRPPATPNRPLSAVYRSDDAISWPTTGSGGSPPRTSGLPARTSG